MRRLQCGARHNPLIRHIYPDFRLQALAANCSQAHARVPIRYGPRPSGRFKGHHANPLTDRFVAGAKAGCSAATTSTPTRQAWSCASRHRPEGLEVPLHVPARRQASTHHARHLSGNVARRGAHKALEARGHVEEGRDPRDVAAQEAGAMTVRELIISYLENHARPNLRSAVAIERRLKKNVRHRIVVMWRAIFHWQKKPSAIEVIECTASFCGRPRFDCFRFPSRRQSGLPRDAPQRTAHHRVAA